MLRCPTPGLLLSVALQVLVLMSSAASTFGQATPTEEAKDLSPVLAPFVSRALVESIVEELEQERVEEEKVSDVYLDPVTGLLWTTADNGRDIDWRRAATYCKGLVLAGYEDWTLPSLDDLETLLRPMAQGAYNMPSKFRLTACCPWSSTKKDEQSAWNFNFQFSKPFSGAFSYTYDHRALCMRSPQEEERALIEQLQKAAKKR
jgi:hypothetical protein